MKYLTLILIFFGVLTSQLFAQNESADEIIERAKKEKKLIAVLYTGSDWIRAGSIFKNRVWDNPKFRETVEKRYILVELDRMEYPYRKIKTLIADALKDKVQIATPSVQSDAGATITREKDDFVVSGINPEKDIYTVRIATNKKLEYPCVKITIKRDKNAANGAHGRSPNGSFCLTEISWVKSGVTKTTAFGTSRNDVKHKIAAVWASNSGNGNHHISKVMDGDESGENYYNVNHNLKEDVEMVIALPEPINAQNTDVLQLLFNSKWGQHTFMRFTLDVIDNKELYDELILAKQRENSNLKRFEENVAAYPALGCFDDEGRLIGFQNSVANATDCTIAKTQSLLKTYGVAAKERDKFLDMAETKTGNRRAGDYGRAIKIMEGTMPWGHMRKHYGKLIESIKKLDEKDQTGLSRHFGFNGRAIADKVMGLVKDKKYKEAETYVLSEMNNPKNIGLTPAQRQDICVAAYIAYKSNPDAAKKNMHWDVLKKGIKYDLNTHQAEGMKGTLMQYGQGPVSVPFGWNAKDISGTSVMWDITQGCARFFRQPCEYEITFRQYNGNGKFKFESVEVIMGKEKIPTTYLRGNIEGKNTQAVYGVKLDRMPKGNEKISIKVRARADDAKESRGSISVRPVLHIE